MPKYQIEIPGKGTFQVESDKELSDTDAYNAALQHAGPQAEAPPEPKSIGGFAENVLTSGGKFIGDIASAVTSPVQTAKGLGNLAVGTIAGMSPMTPEAKQGFQPQIDLAGAVGEHIKQRYGGMDKALETMYKDPVGFAADLSTVAGGAGAVARGVGAVSKVGAITKAGKVMGDIGAAVDPIRGPLLAAGKVAKPLGASERLYQSALKPTTTLSPAEKAAVLETGLKEGIVLNSGAGKNIVDKVDKINKQILDQITLAANQGKAIDSTEVVKRLDDVEKFFANTVDPQPYLDKIADLRTRWNAAHGSQIPIDQAQQMKVNTYKVLRDSYGELGTALTEGQKGLTRGIKEEIVRQVPEVASLNARESKLLTLEPLIERFLGRTGNLNLIGIGTPIAAAGVKAATGSNPLALAAGIAKAVIEAPEFKSRLAIAIRNSKLPPAVRTAPLAVSGRITDIENAQ